jgi:hypothetical protein
MVYGLMDPEKLKCQSLIIIINSWITKISARSALPLPISRKYLNRLHRMTQHLSG